MSFLYPWGLLGLIGIPVLIIIYIIKNKYTEQVVSSTYLWRLSEKFLKKRLPINKLVGIISLILQILAVLFISLAIAQPVFYIGGAANDYCFVLDGSGSMNIVQDGETRLDLAKEEIADIIINSQKGSAYTLIFVGSSTDIVYEENTDKESAVLLLNDVLPAYTSGVYKDALGTAQNFFTRNPSAVTYLVTDKPVTANDNVTVINVASGQENYAVSDVNYTFPRSKLTLTGSAISYESDATLNLQLYLDGAETPSYEKQLEVTKAEAKEFIFNCEESKFKTARVVITNEDSLALDNEVIVYDVDEQNSYSALIVSDKPFRLYAALHSINNKADIETISTSKYNGQTGYRLYIFDSYSPNQLPENAAVWFINPQAGVSKTGFTVQGEKSFESHVYFDYNTTATSSAIKTLLNGVQTDGGLSQVALKRYVQCGLNRGFSKLVTHNGNPLIFAGTTETGNREVVFAFDLEDTDFTVNINFDIFMKNLIEYSFPTVLEKTDGYCGDTLIINTIANCESIRVVAPVSGNISYLDTTSAVSELTLTEVGTYKIVLNMKDKSSRELNVFAALPLSERYTVYDGEEETFIISGEASSYRRDGIYDDLLVFFIILAVIFLADWMVYCYEQYQLR